MRASILSLAFLVAGAVAIPAYAQDATSDATSAVKKGATKSTKAAKKGVTKSTHEVKKGAKKATETATQ